MKLKKYIYASLAIASLFSLVACSASNEGSKQNNTPASTKAEKRLDSITVEDKDYTFEINTNPNTSSIKVEAIYTDGSKVDVSNKTSFYIDCSKVGSTKGVALYEGRGCEFNVTITGSAVTGITFGSKTKTVFEVGDPFVTLTDLDVLARYSNGTTGSITASSLKVYYGSALVNSFAAEGKYTCVVTYTVDGRTHTNSIDINVDTKTGPAGKKIASISLENVGEVIVDQYATVTIGDIRVRALYIDGTSEYVNDVNVACNTSIVGNTVATVTYEGVTTHFAVKVRSSEPEVVVQTYDSLVLDTTNVKKSFKNNEAFNTNNLIVYSVKNNIRSTLANSNYQIKLSFMGEEVSAFDVNGTYKVTVAYTGTTAVVNMPTLEYEVEYEREGYQAVCFAYSGINDAYVIYQNVKKDDVNPLDYIKVPEGYAFAGYNDANWDEVVKGNEVVVINLKKNNPGKAWVSFLNENYTLYEAMEVELNSAMTLPTNTPTVEGSNFNSWSNSIGNVTANRYCVASFDEIKTTITVEFGYSGYYADSWECEVPITGANPADYIRCPNGYFFLGFSEFNWENVESNSFRFVKVYVKQTNSNKAIVSFVLPDYTYITADEYSVGSSVASISSNDYSYLMTKDGYEFVGWSENNIVANRNKYIFAMYEDLNPQQLEGVVTSQIIGEAEIHGNLFELPIQQFIDNRPAGTNLGAFEVVDSNGNQVNVTYYEEGMTTLYVNNLDVNTEYTVYVYYENAEVIVRNAFVCDRNGLSYPFKFIGVRLVTGSSVTRQVKYMYQGDLLYTYYVGYGENLDPCYGFALPDKYADYKLIGTKDNLRNITEDRVVEAILVKKDLTTYTVLFKDNQHFLYDVQQVEAGKDAVPPRSASVPSYEQGNYEYVFKDWGNGYLNITGDTVVYANYTKKEIDKVPVFTMNSLSYEPGYMEIIYKYTPSRVQRTSLVITDEAGNVYTARGRSSTSYFAYLPNEHEYTLTLSYVYKIMNDEYVDIFVYVVDLTDFSTPNHGSLSNPGINSFDFTSVDVDAVSVSIDKTVWYSHKVSKGTTSEVSKTYSGKHIYVRYGLQTKNTDSNSDYLWYDEILEFDTLPFDFPAIDTTRITVPNTIWQYSYQLKGTNITKFYSGSFTNFVIHEFDDKHDVHDRYSQYPPMVELVDDNTMNFYFNDPVEYITGQSYSAQLNEFVVIFTYNYDSITVPAKYEFKNFVDTGISTTINYKKTKQYYINEQYKQGDLVIDKGGAGIFEEIPQSDITVTIKRGTEVVSEFTTEGSYLIEAKIAGSTSTYSYYVYYAKKDGAPFLTGIRAYGTFISLDSCPYYAGYYSEYNLKKIRLYNESGTLVEEQNYEYGAMTIFKGLTNNTKYFVEGVFNRVDNIYSMYTTEKYSVSTNDDNSYTMVKYIYDGNVIYEGPSKIGEAIYSSPYSNSYIKNKLLYLLPANYIAVGYKQTDLKVKEGMEVEIVAVDNGDDTNIPLVYYNGNGTINKVEYCHTIGKIFTPTSIGDVVIGNTKYVFTSFKQATYTITSLTKIYINSTTEAV